MPDSFVADTPSDSFTPDRDSFETVQPVAVAQDASPAPATSPATEEDPQALFARMVTQNLVQRAKSHPVRTLIDPVSHPFVNLPRTKPLDPNSVLDRTVSAVVNKLEGVVEGVESPFGAGAVATGAQIPALGKAMAAAFGVHAVVSDTPEFVDAVKKGDIPRAAAAATGVTVGTLMTVPGVKSIASRLAPKSQAALSDTMTTQRPDGGETTAQPAAPSAPQPVEGTGQWKPAIRLGPENPGDPGRVVTGEVGQTHNDIIQANNLKAEDIDQRGFVDPQGNWHTREDTFQQIGGGETQAGRTHSTDAAITEQPKPAPVEEIEPFGKVRQFRVREQFENPADKGTYKPGDVITEPQLKKAGFAVPEASNPEPTSIMNAVMDRERAARNLPPAMESSRKEFGDTWDAAMGRIAQNPDAPRDLVESLKSKPRAVTDEENALLLHRQVALQNEYKAVTESINAAHEKADLGAMVEGRVRLARLSDDLIDLYNVNKSVGTETARGLVTRKMLANEDFTLANMVTQKRAAKGGAPLSEAETSGVEKSLKSITEAKNEAASGRAKQEWARDLQKDILSQRKPWERAQDFLAKWRRASLLSSPVTLAKLTSAALERMVFTPSEEMVGAGLSKLPGVSRVAAKAPREGGLSTKAEAKALSDGITKGMKDAWQTITTGQSDLDVLFGRMNPIPQSFLDFFGNVHGALKAPVKRNEFSRSLAKRAESAIASGVDVSDPAVQVRLSLDAYRDANRSIFLQDNRVVNAYNAALKVLESPRKETGAPSPAGKALATGGRFLLPIVRVPTNIVAETLQTAFGTVTGSVRLGVALAKGVEKLTPDEADLIMRDLKKGSLGAAVMTLGYFSPQLVGGYYQPGQKRSPTDVKFGAVKIGGVEVPSYLVHNPLLETLQIGATVRRVADSMRKGHKQGLSNGAVAASLGVVEETPFLRETVELAKAFNPNERDAFFGELLKSTVVPQAVQWMAQTMDRDTLGEVIRRHPQTMMEHVEMGIPGLRENVRRKP